MGVNSAIPTHTRGAGRGRGREVSIVPAAQEIRSAFEETGIEQLKPVSKFFHGRISLTTLRLVRCVIVAEAGA